MVINEDILEKLTKELLDADKMEQRREKYQAIYICINSALSRGEIAEINALFNETLLNALTIDALIPVVGFTSLARGELPLRAQWQEAVRIRIVKERGLEFARKSIDCMT